VEGVSDLAEKVKGPGLHYLKVRLGGEPWDKEITYNGERVGGITQVSIFATANDPARVTITQALLDRDAEPVEVDGYLVTKELAELYGHPGAVQEALTLNSIYERRYAAQADAEQKEGENK
jgi:hypothetical protein